MDFPINLQKLLETVLCNNQIYSWNIFENTQGFLNVNIKFSNLGDKHGTYENATYKKVGSRQMQRNKDRATKHVENKNNMDRVKTRNMTKITNNLESLTTEDKECARSSIESSMCLESNTTDLHAPLLPTMAEQDNNNSECLQTDLASQHSPLTLPAPMSPTELPEAPELKSGSPCLVPETAPTAASASSDAQGWVLVTPHKKDSKPSRKKHTGAHPQPSKEGEQCSYASSYCYKQINHDFPATTYCIFCKIPICSKCTTHHAKFQPQKEAFFASDREHDSYFVHIANT